MGEWISVKDRLPDAGSRVVFYDALKAMSIGYYDSSLGFHESVTHWMPLLDAPVKPDVTYDPSGSVTITAPPGGSVMPRTPGPWTVHDLWNNNPCVENGGVYEIEEAHYDVKERLEAGCDVEGVIKGNARLIAQAPEMYALLKELEWAGSFVFSDGTPRCLHCDARKYPNCPINDEIGEHRDTCRLAAVLKAVEGE